MSKNFVKKNLDLSLEFGKYIVRHPNAHKRIPKGAYVFFTVKGDEKFNQDSRELIRQASTKKVIEAHKQGSRWTLQPFIAA